MNRQRRPDRCPSTTADCVSWRSASAGNGVALLLAVTMMMMVFAVVTAWLNEPTLAAIAGTACVTLSHKIAQHVMRNRA